MVTLKDVAQAANVSKSTVSAVLTNRAAELGIKEETCRRVRDAAAQLRYRKNEIAAQMKSNRPNMIALFIPAVDLGELAFRFLLGAGNEAEKFNCYLKNIIFQADPEEFRKQLDYTLGQCPAALLAIGDPGDRQPLLLKATEECSVPLVFMNYEASPFARSVLYDDRSGIREAVRHLYELGHRHILHFTDPLRAQFAERRYRAFREAMHEFGLPVSEDNLFYEQRKPKEFDTATRRLREIFSRTSRPTAVCCGTDAMALQTLTVLQAEGLRIPEDVSIVGFGDKESSQVTTPRLTTVYEPAEEIGRRSVQEALSGIPEYGKRILLPTRLVIRESTGKAPDS